MTDHLSILATLAQHEQDHARHREIVAGWLREAGFSAAMRPCHVALTIETAVVWCSGASDTRTIEMVWSENGASAMVCSYAGRRVYMIEKAATPLEALRALVASGKVPRALLAG